MAADTGGEDPFRRLPDELLRHVLSCLPGKDALQTCMLDTRWRDLWRRATSLVFDFDDYGFNIERCKRLEQIVNMVIHLRGNSPLEKCVISSFPDEIDSEQWIDYALMCQVKELVVRSGHIYEQFQDPLFYDAPLISQNLKIIEFYNLNFQGSSVDFSNCPLLEDLKLDRSRIMAPSISSESLKRLCITGSCAFPMAFHVRIVAPGLISLQLDDFQGLTPSVGYNYMPFLLTAYVGLGYYSHDFCVRNGQGCTKHDCGCHVYPADEGVLLNGLSNAVSLELTVETETFFQFIYRWDLRRCPIFNKLKTLLLNEWFRAIDLVCILQHSPILEMLTLQLDNTKNLIGATGAQDTIEQSFVCAHLKVVNIVCKEVDEGVHKVLNILRTCGVLRDHLSIKAPSLPSYYFSFQKVHVGAYFY